MEPRLNRIVIKPTLACTADCHFCSSRRSLHKELARSKRVPLERWKEILSDAKKLGAEHFVVSGGEPTLFRQLPELIKMGKELGLLVAVNSNGSLMTEERIKVLLDAGLDSVVISLHSHIAEIHDRMKCENGVWTKAVKAIETFSRLTRNNPRFYLITQGIICRENFLTFSDLMRLHYKLGSQLMRISYIEGDFEKKYLLTEREILEFKEKEIPRMIEVCRSLDKSLRQKAEAVLRELYDEKNITLEEYASGIYRPEHKTTDRCEIPKLQALILANGDVHPCNIIEYSHQPIVGNVFEQSFADIWTGEKWNQFRNDPFSYCAKCPMNIHASISLRQKPVPFVKKLKRFVYPLREWMLARK